MPFSGSGTFSRVYNWQDDKNAAIPITASRMDTEDDGFAAGLSNCITRDGQSPATANLPMGGFKLTGLGAGSTAGDSVRYEQVVLLSAGAEQTIARTAAGGVLKVRASEDGASVASMLTFDWLSASPAANDSMILFDATGRDSAANVEVYARDGVLITDPTSGSEDAVRRFGVVTAGTLAYELGLSGAALYPATDAGLDLGAGSQRFAAAHVNTIELGNASDTTLSRSSAGNIAVEGNLIYRAGGTDVPIADGGTGASTAATGARNLLDGLGTTKGNIIYHNGTQWTVLAPP